MSRLFRKYHRWLAIVCALPLLMTVLTGMLYPIAKAIGKPRIAGFVMGIHTMERFGLQDIFPVINGLGVLGLLATGIYMTSLFRPQRSSQKSVNG